MTRDEGEQEPGPEQCDTGDHPPWEHAISGTPIEAIAIGIQPTGVVAHACLIGRLVLVWTFFGHVRMVLSIAVLGVAAPPGAFAAGALGSGHG